MSTDPSNVVKIKLANDPKQKILQDIKVDAIARTDKFKEWGYRKKFINEMLEKYQHVVPTVIKGRSIERNSIEEDAIKNLLTRLGNEGKIPRYKKTQISKQ